MTPKSRLFLLSCLLIVACAHATTLVGVQGRRPQYYYTPKEYFADSVLLETYHQEHPNHMYQSGDESFSTTFKIGLKVKNLGNQPIQKFGFEGYGTEVIDTSGSHIQLIYYPNLSEETLGFGEEDSTFLYWPVSFWDVSTYKELTIQWIYNKVSIKHLLKF